MYPLPNCCVYLQAGSTKRWGETLNSMHCGINHGHVPRRCHTNVAAGAGERQKRRNATVYEKRDVANTSAKQGKISNLKYSLFLSGSGYDSNVTRFVLRDLKTAQR